MTEVGGKFFVTLYAGACLRLLCAASKTFDMCRCISVQVVTLVRREILIVVIDLIVAKMACIESPVADFVRTLQRTCVTVMCTTILLLLSVDVLKEKILLLHLFNYSNFSLSSVLPLLLHLVFRGGGGCDY